jgi:cyclic-di-GMP phosphodiesterase TipF (flagellum assembly factor)
MQTLFHLAFLLCYGGLATAAAVFGPVWLPWLDQPLAFGLGAVILVGGGLLHEIYARAGRQGYFGQQLMSLGYGYTTQQEELTWLRREVETLREGMDNAGQVGGGSVGRAIEEVMAEVKLLKSLVPALSTGTLLEPGSRAKAAAAFTAQHTNAAPPLVKEGFPPRLGPARPVGKPQPANKLPPGKLPPGVTAPVAGDLEPQALLGAVRAALREDRIDLVLQPIVSLPQRRRRFYECFSRLRTSDGAMILPEQYIGLAEREGLITAIDNMLLFRCIQLIRKVHYKKEKFDFFCNISPHSLADEEFFGDFIDFLNNNEELARHLIFEFAQADFALWSEAGARLLDRLHILGCRFSIDQVTDLDLNPVALADLHVSFVKVEARLFRDGVDDREGLVRALRRQEIDLIVEKVEDESLLIELLDSDVDYGQGYLFGEPRPARLAS